MRSRHFVRLTHSVAVLFLGASTLSYADQAHDGACVHTIKRLMGPVQYLGSGQDSDVFKLTQENMQKVRKVSAYLGYENPPMVLRSQTSAELTAQTSGASGGNPAPHWKEGGDIIMSARRASGILEMLVPGKEKHDHFARDTNTPQDQALVDAHVEGHNDFARINPLYLMRDLDILKDSEDLASAMARAYWAEDKEEVVRFYQFLLSTMYLQDIHRGSFEHPDRFKDKLIDLKPISEMQPDGAGGMELKTRLSRPQHPTKPTLSVMQAMVHNLPSSEPAWKTEILRLFERVQRFSGVGIQTKIMNEGWATISEEIILAHAFQSHDDAVEFAQLNSGVARPGLENPYWLGREAWIRIRARFMESEAKRNPEFLKMKPIDQDRAFVAHAHDVIRQFPNDYDFLLHALDEVWVQKLNFLLYRGHENPEFNVAVTRDANRIVRYIAQRFANRETMLPGIELVNFQETASGAMVVRQRNILNMPLSQPSMVKTLYALSQIQKRPIAIDTFASGLWAKGSESSPKIYPMRVTVSPNGDVQVKYTGELPKFRTAERHQKILEGYLSEYLSDIQISYSQVRADARGEKLATAALDFGPMASENVVNYMGHSPTGSHAVIEYYDMVQRRLSTIMAELASGKREISFSKDHRFINIKGLPDIPIFEYDYLARKKRSALLPKTPVDPRWGEGPVDFNEVATLEAEAEAVPPSNLSVQDEDLVLGQGPFVPGDIWKKKNGQGQGEGEGQGEGDEDDADSAQNKDGEDGQETAQPGAQGGGDPSVVRVPIEFLGELLAEQLQLRNLRRTGQGSIHEYEDIRIGSARRPNGYLREDLTAEEDYARGWALAKSRGQDPRKMSFQELIFLGAKHRSTTDLVVADHNPEPMPLTDAVLVFVRDGSGSMGEEHIKLVDEISARIEAVMKHFYKKVANRFVMYSDDATEVTREQFFSMGMGGGTNAVPAVQLTDKILEADYPRSKFNRYVFHFSDGDDSKNEEVVQRLDELMKRIEFFGYGHIDPSVRGIRGLSQAIKDLLRSQDKAEKVGFANLVDEKQSMIDALREFFGVKKKPE